MPDSEPTVRKRKISDYSPDPHNANMNEVCAVRLPHPAAWPAHFILDINTSHPPDMGEIEHVISHPEVEFHIVRHFLLEGVEVKREFFTQYLVHDRDIRINLKKGNIGALNMPYGIQYPMFIGFSHPSLQLNNQSILFLENEIFE